MKTTLRRWYRNLPFIHGMRFRLVMLVLLASLPALGLLFYTASQQRDDALAAGRQEAESLASLATVDQRRIIDQNSRYLATLARLPELRDDNTAACNELVSALLSDNQYAYLNIGAIEKDGTVSCQAGGPLPNDLTNNETNRQLAMSSSQMTIGDVEYGPNSRDGTIAYSYPVRGEDGTVDRLVFISLPFTALDTFVNQANPPEGTVFRIFDAEGNLMSQYPADAKSVDTESDDSDATPVILATPEAGGLVRDTSGTQFLYATSDIKIPSGVGNTGPASVTVSVPRQEIVGRADALFQENLGRLGIVAVLAVMAAWLGAELFTSGDAEGRKRIVNEWYDAFSNGNLEKIDELIGAGYVDHSRAPGQADGMDGIRQVIAAFKTAFPDGKLTPRELLADDDKVVARVTLVGTHVGEFFGLAPSGKLVASEGDEIFRFAGGAIVESWSLFGPLVAVHTVNEAEEDTKRKRPLWRRLRWW